MEQIEFYARKAEEFEQATLHDILSWVWQTFGVKASIGTSFQGAGIVAMHLAYSNGFKFPVFTIDTGLLFPETLQLKKDLEERIGVQIESIYPEQTVEEQNQELGNELWSRKPDLCCSLRKVLPLQKNSPKSMSGLLA